MFVFGLYIILKYIWLVKTNGILEVHSVSFSLSRFIKNRYSINQDHFDAIIYSFDFSDNLFKTSFAEPIKLYGSRLQAQARSQLSTEDSHSSSDSGGWYL
jgi:hypothetical protein